jgi:hypothetical protein
MGKIKEITYAEIYLQFYIKFADNKVRSSTFKIIVDNKVLRYEQINEQFELFLI